MTGASTDADRLCSICVNLFDSRGELRWPVRRERRRRSAGCEGCTLALLPPRLRELNVAMVRAGMVDASDAADDVEARAKRSRVEALLEQQRKEAGS